MSDMVKNYGYIDENSPEWNNRLYANANQLLSGYPLGIITPNVFFPQVPGNVGNCWTYDFPVRYIIADVEIQQLFDADFSILDYLKKLGDQLVAEGCRAVSGNCGYFANFQKELQEYLPVPVAMSSLLQVNWIKSMLKKDEKIGIVCANGPSLTKETLYKVGVEDPDVCCIKGLESSNEFGFLVEQRKDINYYNPRKLGEEVTEAALSLTKENNIGAILLECSDLPPFAHMVARATNLPVFDFTTLHKWMFSGVCRMPFRGFV